MTDDAQRTLNIVAASGWAVTRENIGLLATALILATNPKPEQEPTA